MNDTLCERGRRWLCIVEMITDLEKGVMFLESLSSMHILAQNLFIPHLYIPTNASKKFQCITATNRNVSINSREACVKKLSIGRTRVLIDL